MPDTNNASSILEMIGITKRFPGLVALDHVDFSVRRGEIHALIGQNGAGKSTLMKVLSGVYPIEEGEIRIDGQAARFSHPGEALRLGVGTVYQDLSLVDKLSVADNIFLGRETDGFVINEASIWKRSEAILTNLGVRHINVKAKVGRLPLAQQQLVEIAKVLSHEPRILVLDEPTAPLGDEETTLLFNILNGLKARGIAIIFISHRFKEIMQHCDRATILRNGKLITTVDVASISEEALVELTIGEQIETFYRHNPHGENGQREIVLEVENVSVGRRVRGISFALRRGEILGITGLLGAGQQQLVRALFGDQRSVSGTIKRDGRVVTIHSPAQALKLGIGLLTEYRKVEGLVMDMSVRENITLPSLRRFGRVIQFIDNARERHAAQSLIKQLNIVTPSANTKVNTLSGGNQQKAILARWLLRDLDILIFIEPTLGIDVGAKAEIYQHLNELVNAGKSIIVVSEDLIEVLGISDRILVMVDGQLSRVFDRADASEEALLSAIQGNTHG